MKIYERQVLTQFINFQNPSIYFRILIVHALVLLHSYIPSQQAVKFPHFNGPHCDFATRQSQEIAVEIILKTSTHPRRDGHISK